MQPAFSISDDINDPRSWSKSKLLFEKHPDNVKMWIDFWVICDESKAHLFFTSHAGWMWRSETSLDDFPAQWNRPEVVLRGDIFEASHTYRLKGRDQFLTLVEARNGGKRYFKAFTARRLDGQWRPLAASLDHIYYVKKAGKYLALLEAVYPHPTRKNYWDSRTRFMFAMVADKLEGPWHRVEPGPNVFAGDPKNLFNEDGSRSIYGQVSHFELIRSGYDQKLEIEDFHLQLLFQAFNASHIDGNYDYNDLPWELAVMRND